MASSFGMDAEFGKTFRGINVPFDEVV